MPGEHKKKEETIYYAALKFQSEEERNAYLKRVCGGDKELLARVSALLEAREVKDSFLEPPSLDAEATLDTASSMEIVGTIIGRYKIMEKIGEGGMASVYVAEQEQPFRRKVALKIIKLGMDTKQVIARFEAERQSLAMMDHPNIAKVFDAGTTETGRPYFVMELVKGISITEYCDRNNLNTQERLELFIPICQAIQHAHQKGIIHRDIKPSNVLVTSHDGKPVPKVIDFGIAKATNQRLTEKTLYTHFAQIIGTVEYMSPEQAEMSGLDIDTRTDIYALGVLLYELLTGTTPFEGEMLRSKGYAEMQRIIREEEPIKPSTKLSTLGEALPDLAKHRKVKPELLPKLVRGDLDWIVMKTLEKDRTRRYETVQDFARDIHRHLHNEPVLAGPPSPIYKTRKFIVRHKVAVTTALIVSIAIVAGFIISTVMYFLAEEARIVAEKATNRAVLAQDAEAEQRKSAEIALLRAEMAEKESISQLIHIYEEEARHYLLSNDPSKALVYLDEASQQGIPNESLKYHMFLAKQMYESQDSRYDNGTIRWYADGMRITASSYTISPNREYIALYSSGQDALYLFETRNANLIAKLPVESIFGMAFSCDSDDLLIRSTDKTTKERVIRVFRIEKRKEVIAIRRPAYRDTIATHGRALHLNPSYKYGSVAFSLTNDALVFSEVDESDGDIRTEVILYNTKSDQIQKRHFLEYPLSFFHLRERFGEEPLGLYLGTVQLDGITRCYDLETGKLLMESEMIWLSVVAGPNKIRDLWFLKGWGAQLWDLNRIIPIVAYPDIVDGGFSPDGRCIVLIRRHNYETESDLREPWPNLLINAKDGKRISDIDCRRIMNWHFTPDSEKLITEHDDGEICIWNTNDGRKVRTIEKAHGLIQEVADVSPDSQWLAILLRHEQQPHDVKLVNIINGESYQPLLNVSDVSDLKSKWLLNKNDRIFKFSRKSPSGLVRFNSDGTALVTSQGISRVKSESLQPDKFDLWVKSNIPFRFKNGQLVDASKEEILTAKYLRALVDDGPEHPETKSFGYKLKILQIDENIENGLLEDTLKLIQDEENSQSLNIRAFVPDYQRVKKRLFDSMLERAETARLKGNNKEAIKYYQSSLSLEPEDPLVLSLLSWLQATSFDLEIRNGDHAVKNASKACELTNFTDWRCLSVLAVAYAEAGNYPDAVITQQRAIQAMPRDTSNQFVINNQAKLNAYEKQQSYVQARLSILNANLLIWWPFEKDIHGVLNDQTKSPISGTLIGDGQLATGRVGKGSIKLDGGYLKYNNVTLSELRESITITAWIRMDIGGHWCPNIISIENKWQLGITDWGGRKNLAFYMPGINQTSDFEQHIDLNDDKWHHVAAVCDKQRILLYVDGALIDSQPCESQIPMGDESILIGIRNDYLHLMSWHGYIDDIRIYNTPFSADDILTLMNSTAD